MMEFFYTASPLQWLSIGVLFGLLLLLSIVGGNSIDPAERARDDEAQARDVSQPAVLEHPHVRAGSAYGESLE